MKMKKMNCMLLMSLLLATAMSEAVGYGNDGDVSPKKESVLPELVTLAGMSFGAGLVSGLCPPIAPIFAKIVAVSLIVSHAAPKPFFSGLHEATLMISGTAGIAVGWYAWYRLIMSCIGAN